MVTLSFRGLAKRGTRNPWLRAKRLSVLTNSRFLASTTAVLMMIAPRPHCRYNDGARHHDDRSRHGPIRPESPRHGPGDPPHARHRDARRRLPGLWRGRSPTTVHEADPSLDVEAAEHQGQHRERAAARGRPARHRARAGRGRARGASPASAARRPTSRSSPPCIRRPACSWCAADSPYRTHRRPHGQAGGVRRARAPASSSSPATCSTGSASTRRQDFQAIYLERAGDGPAMVLDGRAAALWGGGTGWPGFTTVAKAGGARFIAPTPDEIARILAKHAFLKPLTLPAGSYPGPGPSRSRPSARGASSWRARRSTTPSPTAWRARCTRAKPRSPRACRRPPRRRPPTPPPPSPRPDLLHPGVARYLREIGATALITSPRLRGEVDSPKPSG